MRLRSLVVTFGGVSIVLLSVAATIVYKQMDQLSRVQSASVAVDRLGLSAYELAAVATRFADDPDPARQRALHSAGRVLARATEAASASAAFVEGDLAAELARLNAQMRGLAERLCDATAPERPCPTAGDAIRIAGASDAALAIAERIAAIAEPIGAQRAARERQAMRLAGGTLLALFMGMGLCALAFWSLTEQRVLRPLDVLKAGFERVGAGALDHRVVVDRDDECGAISRAFNAMVEDLGVVTASRAELEGEVARRAALEEDLRQRNATLTERNAELDAFARIAAHDLRAPLRGVKALAEWMAEDLGADAPPEALFHLTLMRGRISRLDALVDGLQRYVGIGRRLHAVAPFEPAAFIEALARELDPAAAFRIRFDGPRSAIRLRRAPLMDALRELVVNALKHHDRTEGDILVRMRVEGGCVAFTVRDDGPGVPADLQERVFEMFQTLRPRDEVEGSGLGLSLVRKAARTHGGQVRLESPVLGGRGSAFTLTWPIDTGG